MASSKVVFYASWVLCLSVCCSQGRWCHCLRADVGGKPEKSDVVVTYAQPSGAFTPIWLAYEAGLFKKYGLNANSATVHAAGVGAGGDRPRRRISTLMGRI